MPRPTLLLLAATLLFPATRLHAQDLPLWAYAPTPPPANFDATTPKTLPGSMLTQTQAQIENDFTPPDWFPADHPTMPQAVATGRPPAVKACSKCHVTNGMGHPESSSLAGLPIPYVLNQMAALKSGDRKGARAASMIPIAKAISDEELQAAARYYAAITPIPFIKVIESPTAPKWHVSTGGMRYPDEPEIQAPFGQTIVELPADPARMELRDSRTGFVAYVPPGSIARGQALATTGTGQTLACAACHGPTLQGLGNVPGITGRSPTHLFRQLNDIKLGTRAGPTVELMKPVVANLSQDDMVALAAYLAAQAP